jgi:hypothetical protein
MMLVLLTAIHLVAITEMVVAVYMSLNKLSVGVLLPFRIVEWCHIIYLNVRGFHSYLFST